MNQTRAKRHKRMRLKKILKVIMFIGLFAFIIVGISAGYLAYKAASVTSNANQELERGGKSDKRVEAVNPSKDNISVLFLGVDDRDERLIGRTDAMILATFNKDEQSIKMVSIPRDSRVEIVGKNKEDKINHAHSYGGVDMTIDTVEQLLDIPVDYFVKLNFEAFIEIIDSLGGVEVEVPFTFSEQDSTNTMGAIRISAGTHNLNGEEALAFVRNRKNDPRGDFGRGERQQEVIKAIIDKSASIKSITKYDDVIESIGNHLSTNLSFGNLVSLHSYSSSISDITSLHFRGVDTRINGVYYYSLDEDSIQEVSSELRVHLGIDPSIEKTDE